VDVSVLFAQQAVEIDSTAAGVVDESREVEAGSRYLYQDFTP